MWQPVPPAGVRCAALARVPRCPQERQRPTFESRRIGGCRGRVADCLLTSSLAAAGASSRWRPTSDGGFTSLRRDNENDHGGNAITHAIGATAGGMGQFSATWHLAVFRASKPFLIVCDTGRHGCLMVHLRAVIARTRAHRRCSKIAGRSASEGFRQPRRPVARGRSPGHGTRKSRATQAVLAGC